MLTCVNVPCACVLKMMLRHTTVPLLLYLVLKRFWGNTFPAILKVEGRKVPDPALSDRPATPNEE